jgi:pimeloyl-ACP methyl ester carboxylesterase
MAPLESLHVGVDGGALRVGRWDAGPEAPVALAMHGITGSLMCWPPVARRLRDVTLIAPDLRGRGESNRLPGPFGIGAHVRDLIALLDRLELREVIAVGHSMGAYVAALLAARAPQRVRALVLLDGGLPLPVPAGADVDAVLEATLGPALARLRQRFGSQDVYLEFWRKHPAFGETGCWNDDVEAYFRYDLEGAPPDLRPRAAEETVRADGRDLLVDDELRSAFERVRCPVQLVRAPRGLLNQTDPLLPEAVVEQARAAVPTLADELVPDTNHYTLLFAPGGATAVAAAISRAAARVGR